MTGNVFAIADPPFLWVILQNIASFRIMQAVIPHQEANMDKWISYDKLSKKEKNILYPG